MIAARHLRGPGRHAIFGVGIVLGMLIAPRLERLTEPDEEPGDGDDPADD